MTDWSTVLALDELRKMQLRSCSTQFFLTKGTTSGIKKKMNPSTNRNCNFSTDPLRLSVKIKWIFIDLIYINRQFKSIFSVLYIRKNGFGNCLIWTIWIRVQTGEFTATVSIFYLWIQLDAKLLLLALYDSQSKITLVYLILGEAP